MFFHSITKFVLGDRKKEHSRPHVTWSCKPSCSGVALGTRMKKEKRGFVYPLSGILFAAKYSWTTFRMSRTCYSQVRPSSSFPSLLMKTQYEVDVLPASFRSSRMRPANALLYMTSRPPCWCFKTIKRRPL